MVLFGLKQIHQTLVCVSMQRVIALAISNGYDHITAGYITGDLNLPNTQPLIPSYFIFPSNTALRKDK